MTTPSTPEAADLKPDEVFVMGEGLCYLSACAPQALDGPAVEAAVRSQRTAGTRNGWLLSKDPTFSGGQPNPCPCDQDPTRKHWLFEC